MRKDTLRLEDDKGKPYLKVPLVEIEPRTLKKEGSFLTTSRSLTAVGMVFRNDRHIYSTNACVDNEREKFVTAISESH